MKNIFKTLSALVCLISVPAFAAGTGGHSFGIGGGIVSTNQDDLENHATLVNQTYSGENATKPGSALEFSAYYQYRFSGTMFDMQLRPSYFTQSGKGGTDKTTLTGYSIFPLLKLYPLENTFIHFYLQAGLGYGNLSGQIDQPGGSVKFSGGGFGMMGGLGSEFCFTPSHCMFVEGDFRYLAMQRNIVSSSYSNTANGFSQSGVGQELEFQNNDVKTSMSGIIGNIGYQMNF